MPLAVNEINALIMFVPRAVPNELDFKGITDSVDPGLWLNHSVATMTYPQKVSAIVRSANGPQGQIGELLGKLLQFLPQRTGGWPEIDRWASILARPVLATAQNPFEEVLLQGEKPFANRKALRGCFQRLADPDGHRVLRVDGETKTGKSFSFQLLNHAAPQRGFEVNLFKVKDTPALMELAEEILLRLREDAPLETTIAESPERSGRRLANQVMRVIEARQQPRFFVFDEFPDGTRERGAPAPAETLSFISRLARFSEEELRPLLRVVLVKFPGELDAEIEAAALSDVAQSFTVTDMVQVVMQVRTSRQWAVTEDAVRERIEKFFAVGTPSLRDRFDFLKGLIADLTREAT